MNQTIKTLSDFKKALKIGVKLSAIHHKTFDRRDEDGNVIYKDSSLGIREVSRLQTNSFALKTTRTSGEIVDSWCAFPKASECTFADNAITIHEIDRDGVISKVLTYKIEE